MKIDEILGRIEERLMATGQSATAASDKAGLSKDAIRNIRRAVAEGKNAGISTRTLSALAPALQTTSEWLIGGEDAADLEAPSLVKSSRPLASAIVVATVEAGAWREVDEFDQSDPEWQAIEPDPRFPNATQEIYEVSGDSMNALEPHPITPGSRILTVRYDEIASRSPLRDGLVVVVQRTRDGGHTRELSVKQIVWFDDRIEFQPRSTNPKHKAIVVAHDSWEDNGVQVEVRGLVRRIMHEMPI